jgi:hypothetical protein
VCGTYELERLRQVVGSSLFLVSGHYQVRADGDLVYQGQRPGPEWHAHGYFPRLLWMLVRGTERRVRIWKRRWLHLDSGGTCHSRPPDELPSLGFCSLILVLKLFSWLDGPRGVHHAPQVFDGLTTCGDPRSVQRWLRRGLPHAMTLQQALRLAVIERCEPRPVEHLFPGGLSPPEGLSRRRWKDPPSVERLWRALAIVLGSAIELDVPTPCLLAEARGRWRPQKGSMQF